MNLKLKKWISFTAVLAMILTLCACGKTVPGSASGGSSAPAGSSSAGVGGAVTVIDLINLTGDYTDGEGNTYHYTYQLPQLTGPESAYIDQVNQEIETLRTTYVAPDQEAMKAEASLVTPTVTYVSSWYENEILSVVVTVHSDWDSTSYHCFNVTADGKEATNADLLAARSIKEDAFLDRARELMGAAVDEYGTSADAEVQSSLDEIRNQTLSDENCNVEMPMFIGETGTLNFVGHVYSPAGASYYNRIFDTGL